VQPYSADPHTALSVDSAEFRRRAPRVQLSDDPDTATAQTVQEMCRQIHAAASDPLVLAIASYAVRTIRGGPAWLGSGIPPFSNARVMAESCWWWCKHYMRFKHHGSMFEVWAPDLGDPRTKLQLLISPDVLVRMNRMEGDCAIYTMMLGAMLASLGLAWEICTAAVDARQPDIFGHVWLLAVYPDGAREALDASHGRFPGWQVPRYDIHRLKVWGENGREVSSQAGQFDGLHAYRPRRRGLGAQVCDESGCYDDGTGAAVAPGSTVPPASNILTGPVGSSPVYSTMPGTYTDAQGNTWANPVGAVVPAQNTAAYANLAAQLVKGGFTLADLNAMQPGTVINPNGQIIRQSAGYAVTTGGPVVGSTSLLGSSSGSSVLMLAGLGIAALLLFSSMKGGR
jgi:hypothetical protein